MYKRGSGDLAEVTIVAGKQRGWQNQTKQHAHANNMINACRSITHEKKVVVHKGPSSEKRSIKKVLVPAVINERTDRVNKNANNDSVSKSSNKSQGLESERT